MTESNRSLYLQRVQIFFHRNWKQLAEIAVELSIFVPLFFLPSLRRIPYFSNHWLLSSISQATGWEYDIVYVVWIVVLGGILSIFLLFRHRFLLYAYLAIAALRLISLLVPATISQLSPMFVYSVNQVLMYPLRLVIAIFSIYLALCFFGFFPSDSSQSSSDREMRDWQREADDYKRRTGKDYF
jgi:hypothetical protein